MLRRHRADLALILVSLSWGVTFPLIRSALETLSPAQFVAGRFTLAVFAFLPLLLPSPAARAGLRRALLPGALLGAIAWASYTAQTLGLQTVPAGRAAFVTGTNVILVPLIAPLFRSGRPGGVDLAAAALATAGLYLLTLGGEVGAGGAGLAVGDLWVFACALLYAVYIHVLSRVLRQGHEATSLAFAQVLAIAVCGGLAAAAVRAPLRLDLPAPVWVALLVCALLATVGTFWLQTRFQGETTPQRVALIFALEPVFATGFAWWLLGEGVSWTMVAGAILVLGAVLGAELLAPGTGRDLAPSARDR